MKKSIFLKIFLSYVFVTLTLAFLILVFSFKTVKDFYIEILSNNLKNIGLTAKSTILPFVEKKEFKKLQFYIKNLGESTNTRITVINFTGKVLADSKKRASSMENHKTRPEVIEALNGKTGESLRYSTTVKKEMLYVAMPLRLGDKTIILRLSIFLSRINDLLNDLKIKILNTTFIIIFVLILFTFLFSKSLTRPIKKLLTASNRVGRGDFDVKVDLEQNDELKEFADNFNFMVERIKQIFIELSQEKEKVYTIISSIKEGLVVIDIDGKILLSNESFKKIVDKNSINGKFYWEVIRKNELEYLMQNIPNKTTEFKKEMEINGISFICNATFINSSKEIVLTFHNITEMKNLIKIKKDFVVNVSHELRTPLTAIKGFAETLDETENETNRHYIKIIRRHTDRLIHIVNDLITLSELENNNNKLTLVETDMKKLIEDVSTILSQKMKDKNVELLLDVDKNLPKIKVDSFKMEQVFINLVDNAIKYMDRGTITISMFKQDNNLKIEIKDTGIGISQKDISRLFERFYVVDKSRSRKFGGTGLGLSIVKHILLLHNGKIEVKSTVGLGTIFTILLPIISK